MLCGMYKLIILPDYMMVFMPRRHFFKLSLLRYKRKPEWHFPYSLSGKTEVSRLFINKSLIILK